MRRIWWMLALIVGSVIGASYYFWHQATALPSWYRSANASQVIPLQDPDALQQARQAIANKLRTAKSHSDGTHEIYLNDQDLNALAVTELDNLASYSRLRDAVQAIHSRIEDGQLETGAIVNMASIPDEALGYREQEFMLWLREHFPLMFEREVYVGVEGKPTVVNGQLQFDDSLRIRVGNLRLTFTDVAERLGLSEAMLWEKLTQELGTLQIKDIEVAGDQLRLRGTL